MVVFAAAWFAAFLTSQFIEIVTGTLGTYILLWAATGLKSESLQNINNRYAYSYGAYLYAWPIASLILLVPSNRFVVSPITLSIVTAILSLAAGALSWHLLEKPALKYKRRPNNAPPANDELVVAKPADIALPG